MPRAKSLTDEELRRLLRVITTTRYSSRNRLIVLLGHWAGMRVGEIACLTISDVINDDGSVKDTINLSADQTKGSFGRTVHISKRLQMEITAYIRLLRTAEKSHRLFQSQKNRSGFNANSLCTTVKHWYRLAGIDNGSSHSGRRSFLTNLASRGVSARVLQELAGHKNLATTQRYIDVNDGMKRAAIELLS